MSHFVVVVTLKLKPGTSDDFRPHVLENARASRQEPDCHRFDVLAVDGDADTFVIYEEYTDTAAWETHHGTPHFKAFRQAVADMILERRVTRCTTIS